MPKGVGYGGNSMRGMKGGMSMKSGGGGKTMMMDNKGNGMATNRNVKTMPGPIMPGRMGKK